MNRVNQHSTEVGTDDRSINGPHFSDTNEFINYDISKFIRKIEKVFIEYNRLLINQLNLPKYLLISNIFIVPTEQ